MEDILKGLNEKQKEAASASSKPLLVVAGAGSGKTKTLTTRIAYLIAQGEMDPTCVLALTFTNKAAAEMKQRIFSLLSSYNIDASSLFAGTFHSFGASVLRVYAKKRGRDHTFSIYDRDDSLKVARAVCKGGNGRMKPAKLLSIISRIKNTALSPEVYEQEYERELPYIEAYQQQLKKQNAFDFDDLIYETLALFLSDPGVVSRYRKKYTHLFVDEYQDINRAQYLLLRSLVGERGSVSVVGDDAQSIYGFRYADFKTFLSFEDEWKDARVVVLDQNYRSSGRIIKASSNVIACNTEQKEKVLWTDNEEGEKIEVVEYPDSYSEADGVVQRASEAAEGGSCVGILFRTNAQSRPLEQVLVGYGISYQLFGALSFYERKEIKDILSFVRVVVNPSDLSSWDRLEKCFTKTQMSEYRSLVEQYKEKTSEQILRGFLKETAYVDRLTRAFENLDERIDNIDELIEFSTQFPDPIVFLENVTLSDAFQKGEKKGKKSDFSGQAGIFLMTIHTAKGLEFDEVYVTGVNEGTLPHERSYFTSPDLEEERRLMYVAMTRAKKRLSLSFFELPSRFLYEMPPEHVSFFGDGSLDDNEGYIEYS